MGRGLCGGLGIRRLLCSFVEIDVVSYYRGNDDLYIGLFWRAVLVGLYAPCEDIVCHSCDVILVAQGQAESPHESCLARSNGSTQLRLRQYRLQ